MLAFKIIITIMFLIGLFVLLVVIGAGKLRTEEEILNDIEEESKCLAEIEKQKQQKKMKRIFRKNLHIL